MKQIIFIFMAILLATGMASAQKKAVIAADETSHDFGQIKEADGKVSATFVVKTQGMRRWRLPASSLPADVPPRNGQKNRSLREQAETSR